MAVNTLAKINADRKFSERLREQNHRHSLGQIEPELAARMTKPKQAEACFQVFADFKDEDGSRPCSPKFFGSMGQEAAARILEAINANICLGRIRAGNARIETAAHMPAH